MVARPDGTPVDPTDADAVRRHLERFAGADAVSDRDDGALVADFRGVTHVTIHPDGRVETGMPLHAFAGAADRLVFDHDAGELHVQRDAGNGGTDGTDGPGDGDGSDSHSGDGGVAYTFRRP